MKKCIRNILIFIVVNIMATGMFGCADEDEQLAELKAGNLTYPMVQAMYKVEVAFGEMQTEYATCRLTMSFDGTEEDKAILAKAIEAFTKEYEGIEIELVDVTTEADIFTVNWDDLYPGKLSTENNEDSTDNADIVDNAARGYYDLYRQYEVLSLGDFGQQYLNMCTISQGLQALPVSVSGKIFVFNDNPFVQAGIDTPKTVEELLEAGDILKNAFGNDYYPLALNAQDRMELMIYYLQTVYGREWLVDGVLQYNMDEIKEGFDFLQQLEERHVVPTLLKMNSDDECQKDAGWSNGKYAGVFIDSANIEAYAESVSDKSSVKVAQRFDDMGIFNGGCVQVVNALAVSSMCQYPEEAAVFLDYLFCSDEATLVLKTLYGFPLSRSAVSCGEEVQLWDEAMYDANRVAMESDYVMTPEYKSFVDDAEWFLDIIKKLSYGDYNAREAAQQFMGSF